MSSEYNRTAYVSFVAGGAGGTVASFLTCPLEVIKSRLQSSNNPFLVQQQHNNMVAAANHHHHILITNTATHPATTLLTAREHTTTTTAGVLGRHHGILGYARHMFLTEGFQSFFKGLGPNLLGVMPTRAIYFAGYASATRYISEAGGVSVDSPVTHMCAGACAGLVTHTLTAPIWLVKTRCQLSLDEKYTMTRCIRDTYRNEGFTGFYRGLTASYYGVVETVIHFVIYERLKRYLREYRDTGGIAEYNHNNNNNNNNNNSNNNNRVLDYLLAAGFSKSIASVCAYPHEVVRTRLREESRGGTRKYRSFLQTLRTVWLEEGRRGLYGGLGTQLVRQVPNSAVMFMVYETIVYYLT